MICSYCSEIWEERIEQLQSENTKLKKQIDLMHDNGLGESWVEKFEAGVYEKDEQIKQLQSDIKAKDEVIKTLNRNYDIAIDMIRYYGLEEKFEQALRGKCPDVNTG